MSSSRRLLRTVSLLASNNDAWPRLPSFYCPAHVLSSSSYYVPYYIQPSLRWPALSYPPTVCPHGHHLAIVLKSIHLSKFNLLSILLLYLLAGLFNPLVWLKPPLKFDNDLASNSLNLLPIYPFYSLMCHLSSSSFFLRGHS